MEKIYYPKRVIGKENLVYSPYTKGTYVVDITGLMPGERARCPYTGRIFTIPNIGDASNSIETKEKKLLIQQLPPFLITLNSRLLNPKI